MAISALRAEAEERERWKPASEPPDDNRDVQAWVSDGVYGYQQIGHFDGEWSMEDVALWRELPAGAAEVSGGGWRRWAVRLFFLGVGFACADSAVFVLLGREPRDRGSTHSVILLSVAAGILSLREKKGGPK